MDIIWRSLRVVVGVLWLRDDDDVEEDYVVCNRVQRLLQIESLLFTIQNKIKVKLQVGLDAFVLFHVCSKLVKSRKRHRLSLQRYVFFVDEQ